MRCICQDIAEIQQDAAAWPTGELRFAIHRALGLMDTALESMRYLCQNTSADGSAKQQVEQAQAAVLMHTMLVALYVRELTKRPAPDFISTN